MVKIIDVVQLLLIIPAFLAAITAFVLGARPVQPTDRDGPERKMHHVFRERPFLLSPVPIVSLIAAVLAMVAIITKPLTGDDGFRNPSVSIIPTATATTSVDYMAATVGAISVLPFTATPTSTPTPSPEPTSTPTLSPTPTVTITSTMFRAEAVDPVPVFVPETRDQPSTIIATPTPVPTAPPSALIPRQCISNDEAMIRGFGFVEPRSHNFLTDFRIRIREAENYTIRYSREDLIPASTNITDWAVPWTCADTIAGPRCQRDRPGRNDINSQGTMVVPGLSWVKEDATYTFLLQIELRQGSEVRELCAYVYDVR
jgi:hypothetical protein